MVVNFIRNLLFLLKNNSNMFAWLTILYNVKIHPSYHSFKHYLKEKWPYMLIIHDVKSNTPRIQNQNCQIFSSYSYLGNHSNEKVQNDAIEGALMNSTGNHGPRMLLGNTKACVDLEHYLASFFQKEACLVSSSGYITCSSIIKVLCKPNNIVFADAHCHASLVTGLNSCKAKVVYFKHNSHKSLELLLNWYKFSNRKKIVLTESLFSMDGTICDLPNIKSLCVKHNALLVVDEAHGLGTLGHRGNGIEDHFNMPNSVDVIMGTFSKSLSNLGGYVCSSLSFIEECEYYSHSNVFTAGISAYHASGALSALKQINPEKVQILHDNTRYFRKMLTEAGFTIKGHNSSPIIPVVFPYDVFKLIDISHEMRGYGYAIAPVLPPACSIKTPLFRITATCTQSYDDISSFVHSLRMIHDTYVSKIDESGLQMLKVFLKMKNFKHCIVNIGLNIWSYLLQYF